MKSPFRLATFITLNLAFFFASSWLLAAPASAQLNPCPNLGVLPNDEICIVIGTESQANMLVERGPAPLMLGTMTFGDYEATLVADYVATPVGMAVTLEGNVQRVGFSSAGAHLTVDVEGGRANPLPAGELSLMLTGNATGASETITGGSAGFFDPSNPPLPDYVGSTSVVIATTYGAEDFDEFDPAAGAVPEGAITVRSHNVFHITNVGDTVFIPAGTGGGEPVYPEGSELHIVLRMDVDGKKHHLPFEQFRVLTNKACDGAYFEPLQDLAFSLEGGTLQSQYPCGVAIVGTVELQTVAIIKEELIIEEDTTIPEGDALLVERDVQLTVRDGATLTIAEGASFTNLGEAFIEGRLEVEEGATVDNRGTFASYQKIGNGGTVGNCEDSVFENAGDFRNRDTGALINRGYFENAARVCNQGTVDDQGKWLGDDPDKQCEEEEEE